MRLRGEAREDEPWKILGRGNPNIPAERSADLGAAARAPGLVPRLGVWGGGLGPRPAPTRPGPARCRRCRAAGLGLGSRSRSPKTTPRLSVPGSPGELSGEPDGDIESDGLRHRVCFDGAILVCRCWCCLPLQWYHDACSGRVCCLPFASFTTAPLCHFLTHLTLLGS